MQRFIIKTPRDAPPRLPPPPPGLPDPNDEDTIQGALECAAINDAIGAVPKTRKRGSYGILDEEDRLKIARYAIELGPAKTARHFSSLLCHPINESTVRSIRNKYQQRRQKDASVSTLSTLPREKRGPPPMLGENLDAAVQQRLRRVRDAGGVINRTIVIATGKGLAVKRNLPIPNHSFSRGWAASLMKRMHLVKRKATKAARKLPENFSEIRDEFIHRVVSTVRSNEIPGECTTCNRRVIIE